MYNGSIRIIGVCSICGGNVVMPLVWMSVRPPIPRCESCGAIPQGSRGPIIPMEPPGKREWEPRRRRPYWDRPYDRLDSDVPPDVYGDFL